MVLTWSTRIFRTTRRIRSSVEAVPGSRGKHNSLSLISAPMLFKSLPQKTADEVSVVQDDTQQRTVNTQSAIVVDETQPSEFVHEEADS